MTTARRAAGMAVAVTAALLLGALSRFGWDAGEAREAELRLAWRARAPLVEECRRLTETEREALPAHMRREVVCEGRVARYRLDVAVGGEPRLDRVIRGAGARGDRPLYVFETLRLPPGRHELRVRFERAEDAGGGGENGFPALLELERRVELEPGRAVLITYDEATRRLVARTR